MPTREECMARAARAFAVGRDLMMATDPHEAAEEAAYAGGPSVDELERRIRESRSPHRFPTTDPARGCP